MYIGYQGIETRKTLVVSFAMSILTFMRKLISLANIDIGQFYIGSF